MNVLANINKIITACYRLKNTMNIFFHLFLSDYNNIVHNLHQYSRRCLSQQKNTLDTFYSMGAKQSIQVQLQNPFRENKGNDALNERSCRR